MGLDMYLSKKIYVKNWDFYKSEEKWEISVKRGGYPIVFPFKCVYLEFEVAYWRKANAIHKWFVDHVQGGEDRCQTSHVTREELQQLYELCHTVKELAKTEEVKADIPTINEKGVQSEEHTIRVISNPKEIAELLPTQEGFFFGDTDYDEWYLRDIDNTIAMLSAALADPIDGEFYYEASW
jgi:hypothetical protein